MIIQSITIVVQIYKKLAGRAVRIATKLRHGNGRPQIGDPRFVHNWRIGVDGSGHRSIEGGLVGNKPSGLDNKSRNRSMKEYVVVISVIDVVEKIVDRDGRVDCVEFDADISLIGI